MTGRVAMVTGANSGIGKATALALAKRGATVVMVCRDTKRGEAAKQAIIQKTGNSNVDLLIADLSSQHSIRSLMKTFGQHYKRLDVLINNAGVYLPERQTTDNGLEKTLAVNYLAPFLLSHLLLPMLKRSAPSRILNVAGSYHRFGKIHFEDMQFVEDYRAGAANNQTQLARVLFTYELARRLEGTGVTVNCLHPGSVRTNIQRHMPQLAQNLLQMMPRAMTISPEKAAERILYVALSLEVEGVTGKYFVNKRPVASSKASYDEALAKRLWKVSEHLTGLSKKKEKGDKQHDINHNAGTSSLLVA